MTRQHALAHALLLGCVGCGPDVSSPGGSGGQSGSSSTSGETSGSTTGAPLDCTEVVAENLVVDDDTDRAWLATVREVHGDLTIHRLGNTAQLSELGCLERIEGKLSLRENPDLVDLRGLSRLAEVDAIDIVDNTSLETLAGLDSLERTGFVQIIGNPALQRLELTSLTEVSDLHLGFAECPHNPGDPDSIDGPLLSGDNPQLASIDDLTNLRSAGTFAVLGQSAFNSTARIAEITRDLREDVGPLGIGASSTFMGNPNLAESEIAEVFAADGRDSYGSGTACENRDDDRECEC